MPISLGEILSTDVRTSLRTSILKEYTISILNFQKYHLLDAGWQDSAELESIYQDGLQIIQDKKINDLSYLIKLLKRKHPNSYGQLTLNQSGSFTRAIVANTPDELSNLKKVERNIQNILTSPVVNSASLMPDACPAGSSPYSTPVGAVIAAENAIIPAAHSADICCSLSATFFQSNKTAKELIDTLHSVTRFGPGGRPETDWVHHPVLDEAIGQNPFLRRLQTKAQMHMADQGDGNHFASIGEMQVTPDLLAQLQSSGHGTLASQLVPDTTLKVLITHHGSRGLGSAVYQRGLAAAVKQTRKYTKDIPEELAWLTADSAEGQRYWEALQYIARWTEANHRSIHQRFLQNISSEEIAQIGNAHNFVWKRGSTYLHGKGATPAWCNDDGNPLIGIIPMNMAAPTLLTLGANNESFLSFSPHGAGRNLSRTALLKRYFHKRRGLDSVRLQADMTKSMHAIDARWYLGEADITECAVAYKDQQSIREQIDHFKLAHVIAEIKPLGCIMAGRAPKSEKPLTPKQLRQIEHRANRRKTWQRNWLDEM